MFKDLLLPKNLDIDSLIAKLDDPFAGCGITAEKIAFICHSIIWMKVLYKEDYLMARNNHGFVPLCSTILKDIVPQYNKCIDFLVRHDVILCDRHFIRGQKCYGYNFTKKYLGTGIKELKVCREIRIQLQKQEAKYLAKNPMIKRFQQKRSYLHRTVKSPLLRIDADAAIKDIVENYGRLKFQEIKDLGYEWFDRDNTIEQIEHNRYIFYQLIKLINNKDFEPNSDLSGFRFHSPITRLPKFLRKYLTYDNKPLVALDLKNSQPYFSLLLLNREFYLAKNKKKGQSLRAMDEELYKLLTKGYLNPIVAENVDKVLPNCNPDKPIITLPKILETLANMGHCSFKNYIQDVSSGLLYDKFLFCKPGDANYSEARAEIKLELLKLLYGRPSKPNCGRKFLKAYEGPFEVFNMIKSVVTGRSKRRRGYGKRNQDIKIEAKPAQKNLRNPPDLKRYPFEPGHAVDANKPVFANIFVDRGYTKLATLLQRIESYWLLDVVCKKVVKLSPRVPLVTIHDSIASTEEFIPIIEEVINDTLTKVIGFPPKLQKEYWGKEVNEIINP